MRKNIFIFGVGIFLGYSFDVELSDLSIYEVFDAQLRKLKKLERVEVVGTPENRPPLRFTTIQKTICYLITVLCDCGEASDPPTHTHHAEILILK